MNYLPDNVLQSPWSLTGRLRLLMAYRDLAWMLTWRDIRVRYKHSVFGTAWAIIPPVLMMLVFTFVFGAVTRLDPRDLTGQHALPYSLFALAGLVPWAFFAGSLTGAANSLVSNRPLLTKVYFPREVFPFAAVGSAFVDFLIGSAALIVMTIYYHFTDSGWEIATSWSVLVWPVVVGVQVIFTMGMAFLLSMANLFYRDVGFLFRSIIQLWMFVTCVVYQLEPADAWKRALLQLNPMTPIINAHRDCLLLGRNPFTPDFCLAAGISIVVFCLGWYWFARRECDFAERA